MYIALPVAETVFWGEERLKKTLLAHPGILFRPIWVEEKSKSLSEGSHRYELRINSILRANESSRFSTICGIIFG